jgi:MtN3 and saliva related transmembrane protein
VLWSFTTLLGVAAAALTTFANVPQVLKAWRTKDTKDLSFAMTIILASGLGLWVIYGLLRADYVIVLANGIAALLALAEIAARLTAQRSGHMGQPSLEPEPALEIRETCRLGMIAEAACEKLTGPVSRLCRAASFARSLRPIHSRRQHHRRFRPERRLPLYASASFSSWPTTRLSSPPGTPALKFHRRFGGRGRLAPRLQLPR